MKMKKNCSVNFLFLLTTALAVVGSDGFSTTTFLHPPQQQQQQNALISTTSLLRLEPIKGHEDRHGNNAVALARTVNNNARRNTRSTLYAVSDNNNDDIGEVGITWTINPIFASILIAFIGFGTFVAAPGVPMIGSDYDTSLIAAFLDDPLHPVNVSLIFVTIFNLLGIMPLIITSLMIPQGSKQGLPALPFALTGFAGFPGFAPYLIFRAPTVETKTLAEASWFTANVLENKLFSWLLVGLVISTPITTGLVDSLLSVQPTTTSLVSDFWEAYQSSKAVSISSFDCLCLTVSAAALIPKDYQIRTTASDDDDTDQEQQSVKQQQGQLIALATMGLPVLGAALYCALRPPLPKE